MTIKQQQQAAVAELRRQWGEDDSPLQDEVLAAVTADETTGFCTHCEEWTEDYIEPDVDFSPCPACGNHTVFAAEQILVWCCG